MGGRSLGDRTFDEGTMVFAGEINTEGGGFSSLRLLIDQGEVASATNVRFTVKKLRRAVAFLYATTSLTGVTSVSATSPKVPLGAPP